jgi:hypothetical protein
MSQRILVLVFNGECLKSMERCAIIAEVIDIRDGCKEPFFPRRWVRTNQIRHFPRFLAWLRLHRGDPVRCAELSL